MHCSILQKVEKEKESFSGIHIALFGHRQIIESFLKSSGDSGDGSIYKAEGTGGNKE
jgi:hypothetical protein